MRAPVCLVAALLCLLAGAARADVQMPGPAGSLILFQESRSVPLVRLVVVLRGGQRALAGGQEGLAAILPWLPERGARGVERLPFAALERSGYGHGADRDAVWFEVTPLRDQADEAAGALAQALLQPWLHPPEREVLDMSRFEALYESGLRKYLKEAQERELASSEGRVARCLRQALYPGHPLGRSLYGTDATAGALSVEDAVRLFGRSLVGGNVVFGVSGPLSSAEASALVHRHFARLRPGPALALAAPPPPPRRTQIHLVEAAEGEEVLVGLGQRPMHEQAALAAAAQGLMDALEPEDERARGRHLHTHYGDSVLRLLSEPASTELRETTRHLIGAWSSWLRADPARWDLRAIERRIRGRHQLRHQTTRSRLMGGLLRAIGVEDELPPPTGLKGAEVAAVLRELAQGGAVQVCVAGNPQRLLPELGRLGQPAPPLQIMTLE